MQGNDRKVQTILRVPTKIFVLESQTTPSQSEQPQSELMQAHYMQGFPLIHLWEVYRLVYDRT